MSDSYDDSTVIRHQLDKVGVGEILKMDGLTEIAINQPRKIWFDRGNGWESIVNENCSLSNLEMLAQSLSVRNSTGGIDASNDNKVSSIHSVTLPDMERGQIILPPSSEDGTISFTIRKPSFIRRDLQSYLDSGRLSNYEVCGRAFSKEKQLTKEQTEMIDILKKGDIDNFFRKSVQYKLNHIMVGATGSGKTTVMKAIADLYPANRRYITIEDTHELDLPNHPNHVHLFFKREGVGVTAKELIEASMRMKPDHIFLTELRGEEAWSYLGMLNTGHSGSLTSTHAEDNPAAVYSRLTTLIKESKVGSTLDYHLISNTVASTIDIISFWKGSYMTKIYFNPEEKNDAMSRLMGVNS
ncbi:P-type DNA transfer ATPase VirB11 [Pectobacterium atrosepticum ICMP 1526]|uniref:P-type DNA transfer ATPase VirB11 n=1 Tax=Pectobacterium atrosepticum TaxID=29471 RepID=UPI0004FFD2A2|nr:P-type DNA transfer ATPase VirB11 [Pectobacterium atrosepticum]KFX10707.1 secretion system protein E [Pectobacterium atrosepticum]KMK87265.1 P-type DNA transfer ATPase VirB11 [Pectobacterium atrosepticum ICMP 1526]